MELRAVDYVIGASSLSLKKKVALLSMCSQDINETYRRIETMEQKYNHHISMDTSYRASNSTPFGECIGIGPNMEEILDEIAEQNKVIGTLSNYLISTIPQRIIIPGFNEARTPSFNETRLNETEFKEKIHQELYIDLETITRKLMEQSEIVKHTPFINLPPISCAPRKYQKYYGDPLGYFEQKYQGTISTRAQLRLEDGALYKALGLAGKISLAIPTLRGYTSEDRKAILDAHTFFGGNAVAASKILGKSRRTISKMWTEAGLPPSRKKNVEK